MEELVALLVPAIQRADVAQVTTWGAGFKFQNPNVKSTCGCGSSFSV